ncbi:MAG: hypothetical protein U1E36_00805 [Rickettsiales bacterium]
MSDKENTTSEEKKKGGKLPGVLFIVSIIVLGVIIKMTVIFFLLAMLPTIVAWYIDSAPRKPSCRIVMMCNLSGVIPFMANLINEGNKTPQVLQMFSDFSAWFVIYASAGVGWLLVWGCPYLIELCIEITNSSRIAKLESVQKKLVEEWGPEIKRSV